MSYCFLVGIIGADLRDIGGGSTMLAPFFVAIIGLPVYTLAGAALMGTFITSVAGDGFLSEYAFLGSMTDMAVAHRLDTGSLIRCWRSFWDVLGCSHSKKFVPARIIKGISLSRVSFSGSLDTSWDFSDRTGVKKAIAQQGIDGLAWHTRQTKGCVKITRIAFSLEFGDSLILCSRLTANE